MALRVDNVASLRDAPVGEFVQVSKRRVALKTLEFLDPQFESFTLQDKVIELPLCSVLLVNCLSILSCYLIDIPSFHMNVDKYHLRIRRQEVLGQTNYKGANFIYQDKFINVVHSDEGATLISPSKLSRVIKPEMVRKTDKKGA